MPSTSALGVGVYNQTTAAVGMVVAGPVVRWRLK
jgi:hypothetical protein